MSVMPPEGPIPTNPRTGLPYSASYWRRIQRGMARGLTRAEARGHGPRPGPRGMIETETQRRTRISVETYGMTPYRRRAILISQEYGITYPRYLRIRNKIEWINDHSTPGAQIQPIMIKQAADQEAAGILPPGWIEQRLDEKIAAMEQYMDMTPAQGKYKTGPHHVGYSQFHDNEAIWLPVEWWYYHGVS